ncbi:flavodoxin domain-containing protein [Streptomyces sp. NBC_00038]|uniref:flavodoxin domain-containing protein n=1 Tax=Streptomyces sp. NBC_00038 TaxID=2903615 RepID=UPI00225B4909|nr:flavodoxin domain-containing protein [Streptomyces sp. NBC_00038]MCX5554676.1 flavodoxin domain-containing protein [Streptomyces sp. NBC_00038]
MGYASEHGSTRGVAESLGNRLRELGHQVDVRPVDEKLETDGYDAFVLGSAIHSGAWMPAAADFVRARSDELCTRPVWFFSVGLARVVGGWFEEHAAEPKQLPELRRAVRPRGHWLFAGALEREHIPAVGRVIYRLMGGRYGDFRDWEEVHAWALEIALDLAEHSEAELRRSADTRRLLP